MKRRNWTNEEDQFIKDNFGKITFQAMAKRFDCSIETVEKRAEALGFTLKHTTQNRWTKEEVDTLVALAPTHTNKEIATILGRNTGDINKKARNLGIKLIFKHSIWTEEMITYLKANINIVTISEIMNTLNVTYEQIMQELKELGIVYKSDRWTEEEIQILRDYEGKCYIEDVAKLLNRSVDSARSKAQKLGLNYKKPKRIFLQEELDYIKNNWGKIPITDMARKLKVGRIVVQRQADLMNLPKLGHNPYQKWTPENIERLQVLAKTKTISELAKIFKTTNHAIVSFASNNDIDLIDTKVRWTEEKKEELAFLAKTMSAEKIAKEMNLSIGAIRSQAKRMGITLLGEEKYLNSIWTEENTLELKRLVSEGKTLLEITRIMQKKDGTILKKAKQLGLEIKNEERKEWNEEEIELFRKLAQEKKLSELVLILNRTSSSLKKEAQKLGITLLMDKPVWREEDKEKLSELVSEGLSPKEIALILGRSEDAINIKINHEGLSYGNIKFWSEEEEVLLTDLWGSMSFEKIAQRLNRSVSSILNKAYILGLGSQKENNYDGITTTELAAIFNVHIHTIDIYWVALGLKVKTRAITSVTSYRYVEINDLWNFLEQNQNIWDSRCLEKNILGKEPVWMEEKRRSDYNAPKDSFGLRNLARQQIMLNEENFLEIAEGQVRTRKKGCN